MVVSASAGDQEGKVDYILKAAQQRLGLYGYDKTTMQEIADDISMSKAALYYYFPDKESLFRAIIENEQNEYFHLLDQRMLEMTDADQMIEELVKLRQVLYRKFLNLGKFRLTENHKVKPLLRDLYNNMRQKETEILCSILEKGEDTGIFRFDSAPELANLFVDLLQGIRIVEMKRMSHFEMSVQESDNLAKSIRLATEIFIKGLKYNKLTQI